MGLEKKGSRSPWSSSLAPVSLTSSRSNAGARAAVLVTDGSLRKKSSMHVVVARWHAATPAWPRRRPEVEQELWGIRDRSARPAVLDAKTRDLTPDSL